MTTKEMSDFLNSLWCWARCTEEEQRKLSEIADYLSNRGNEKNDCISRDEVCRYVAEFVNHEFSTREEEELIDNIITGIERMPSVTPQEPQSFKWCTDCKEYDTEKHCCHRYSKVIRNTVAEIRQEPFKPMVEIDLYSVIKQKYIEREVLGKIRAEIENDWQLKKYPSSPFSCGLRRAIEIIDKYKAESEG